MSNPNPYNFSMPQTSNYNTFNTSSLPIWAWVLIIIGIIIVIILIIALIWYAVSRSTKPSDAAKMAKAEAKGIIIDPLAIAE